MLDKDLRSMIGEVKDGRMDRRAFIQRLAAVGLTAPLANQILAIGGVAMAQSPSPYPPTKRGGGGPLKLLWWQGPTLLNPHFATGTKDQDAARLFYEPLANWDADGNLKPVLAESIPGLEDGTLAKDGKSVTWKLKKNVKWMVELGSQSYGNAVVSGGTVYVGTNNESLKDPKVTGDKGILVSVLTLQEGEERIVADRLAEILKKAAG